MVHTNPTIPTQCSTAPPLYHSSRLKQQQAMQAFEQIKTLVTEFFPTENSAIKISDVLDFSIIEAIINQRVWYNAYSWQFCFFLMKKFFSLTKQKHHIVER